MNQADVRVIATDLDGTLLRSDSSISERTLAALAAAEDAGITVVFVTGRPVRWMEDLFAHVGAHSVAILSNGALVWDVANHRPITERPIEVDVLRETCGALRAAVPDLLFGFERLEGLSVEATFLGKFTGTFAARAANSPKVAFFPVLIWATTPSLTVISAAGTCHCAAAACTSIARAVAPACRSCAHELETAVEPPVPCTLPLGSKAKLPYSGTFAGALSTRI